ncbi:hypothetical protein V1264_000309 [Littorina saxatilis]|uniref:Uncharacterized protein n=1 Tax=Littorina saxatilis TaxID=31220 RepID=A0AAN9GPK0_9CAEN
MICEMQKTSKQTGLEREGIDCASCVTTPAPITTTTLPPTTTIPPTTCPTIEELSGIAGFCYFDQANVDFSTCPAMQDITTEIYCMAGPLMTDPATSPNLDEEPCHCVDADTMQALDDEFGNPPKIGAARA